MNQVAKAKKLKSTKPKKPKTANFLSAGVGPDKIQRRKAKETFPGYKKKFVLSTFEANRVMTSTFARYRSTYIFVLSKLRPHKDVDTTKLIDEYLLRSTEQVRTAIVDEISQLRIMLESNDQMEYPSPYDVEVSLPGITVEKYIELIRALDSLFQALDLAQAKCVIEFEERDRLVKVWSQRLKAHAGKFQSLVAKINIEAEEEREKNQNSIKDLINELSKSEVQSDEKPSKSNSDW